MHNGMSKGNPLSVALTIFHGRGVEEVNEVQLFQELNIEKLSRTLDEMHRTVFKRIDSSSRSAIELINRETKIIL